MALFELWLVLKTDAVAVRLQNQNKFRMFTRVWEKVRKEVSKQTSN